MKKKLKLFYVTLKLPLVHTNMIIYFCLYNYPKELFPYVKPEIHSLLTETNDTYRQRIKNNQNVFVGDLLS